MKSDLVIPSASKYVGAESETDYRILEVDLTAISDSDPPRSADSDGLGSGTSLTSDLVVVHHQEDDSVSSVIDGARLQVAVDVSTSASHRSLAHQAHLIKVNTETTQDSASYVDLDATKEEGERRPHTRFIKRSDSSAVSSDKIACAALAVAQGSFHSHPSHQSVLRCSLTAL